MANSENIVLTSTLVLLGSTIGGPLVEGKGLPPSKTIIGGFLAMLLCSILAEFDGDLGSTLAVVIAGQGFILYGLPAINGKYAQSKPLTKQQTTTLKKVKVSI